MILFVIILGYFGSKRYNKKYITDLTKNQERSCSCSGLKQSLRKKIWDVSVAIRSGTEFGKSGENHIRLTYSVSEETIEKGMQVVSEFFKKIA